MNIAKAVPLPAERDRYLAASHPGRRVAMGLAVFTGALLAALFIGLRVGYSQISLDALLHDESTRLVFFQLRLPRVAMAAIVGASLAGVGAALQALFRNPLAEPFTLGVSGGGALGASVAIAFSLGARIAGVPLVFLTSFLGAALAVAVVYTIARGGRLMLPGALLLAGVVINLIAGAAVVTLQYIADYTRALEILRWMIGSLDVVGFDLIWRMLLFVVPGWALLLWHARDLHLLAVGEETAASLGVDVRRTERMLYGISSLVVGVAVAVGGTIGFVGLIVPHAVRLMLGEDVRIVLPCSFLLGAAFLILADTVARTILGASELPVGAVTAILGGPVFLWLLRRRVRYSAM